MKKTYQAYVYCKNCLRHSEVSIPQGMTVKQWITKNKECPNCLIKTLVEQIQERK